MRHRHQPRLCGTCRAPMARQQDACSRCATPWAETGLPSGEGGADEPATGPQRKAA
jgi:predicted amidophosphoribosyltransferase